ncbi:MAG: 2-amino-4-hydroxy-6-hydroxymethyldihydropteridine diphosphokinase [Candidatus Raymondbacteria bacterium RifOxyA12_full_50_37]|uniref:2-amino-4-hydroxy-6-hydroxymethyldihydropteridine diphosphokinase n=1 Tax=Candidatus Raymondbacteria bacterium RIFOXYD12_FULL_49_13 TaxID=1817890 RepID=A0A1F7F8S2_UNCRA|nr:MAG: 2-amino-4-hydroxy-6-hydroxymethyldihydropteridine diphosphokinase [Candidatus Raymondbacteria bacterium RifOxyA12_full_50_37]OGJ85434.1 MAG: 2-amino-4-hydroxy-6-hydroxymethyldihydropteridine diphosphokinase [Candidatus Raymondbacteria bacterium RIFOXYA2_FULL_49_16]OGJ91046.1 MAG: 2-amino-4-hydroxy-6-hydroxymethyldihydropteridine diphosphokinase [Candidatus Raymondbacteria bacterium RifOxyB12_full_50_8]OGJ94942.1 MAG: 2-amino-4-hydroxy-6-hydroxymethyldihydropteridine diphosphokinase [Cand
MAIAYIGYGSNQGDRLANIQSALSAIFERGIGTVLRKSRNYESAPVQGGGPGKFINGAVEVMTDLEPTDLLHALQRIEADLGRTSGKGEKLPRLIDLDILIYDSNILKAGDLTVPHPELPNRLFVLRPLNDIKPDLFHPLLQKTVSELLEAAPAHVRSQEIGEL